MTVMPFRGADPALILRCHGLEHAFYDATEDAWNDLGGDVEFNFPYLAAELLHAAAEVEDDGELPPPEFAAMSDDRFGKYWVEAVARASNWQPRGAGSGSGNARRQPARRGRGGLLTGRGISLNSGFGGYVATVAEVQVDPRSGRIWARRWSWPLPTS